MSKIGNKIIGIDLGTTNSCVAIVEGKNHRVLENNEGFRTTPSVVSYDQEGDKFLVGIAAKRQAAVNPETVFSVKRKMGTSEKIHLGGKNLTPEEISAKILGYLKSCAEEKLNEGVTRAVITVPAYFNDAQRKATENAGKIAGLKVERIINEPTAAALAYGFDRAETNQNIVVYDLGGGTFDVSVLSVDRQEGESLIQVLATSGINDLGGDDFNHKIIDYLVEKFKKENNIDLRTKDEKDKDRKITLQRLQDVSEQAKHELSSKIETTVSLPYIASRGNEMLHLNVKISRADFENLTKDYMKRTAEKIDEVIREAKLTKDKISQVILVGGSTRMPMVTELIRDKFGDKKINKSVNPDEVVAVGAAIQGAILSGGIKDVLLLDVTPLSLGIEIEGGMMDIIIPKNTTIPKKEARVYSTAVDNQPSVHIRVLQGERPRALDNKVLGTFELTGIEPAPRGIPQIEVTFDIDTNGIASIAAKDKKTGREQSIIIKDSQGLNEAEIERMIKEAEENRERDEEFKSNLETLNRAKSYCYTFENQLKEFESSANFNKDDEQFQEFKRLYDDLKKATEESNYPELKKQLNEIDKLMKLSNELMQKMPKRGEKKESDSEDVLDVEPKKNSDKK